MTPFDRYTCFADLLSTEVEGRDFSIDHRLGRSGIVVLAPHGGEIEPGTTEIARAVAFPEHTFYSLVGMKARGNRALHITSARFDEPLGEAIVRRADSVVAVHGCKGAEPVVYVGGLDDSLKQRVESALEQAGFIVGEEPDGLKGRHPMNLCNRNARGAGVQIELTTGLRSAMFEDLTREGRTSKTPVFHHFVAALRSGITRNGS